MNKIFQIGLNKCATLSLYELFHSFCEQKINAIHWDYGNLAYTMKINLDNDRKLLYGYEDYTVFTDMECCCLNNGRTECIFAYKWFDILDKQYPNSKFILNTRNIDKWIQSRLDHECGINLVDGIITHLDPRVPYIDYHMEYFNITDTKNLIELWRNDWINHHNNIISYFSNRPNDLLIYDCETDSLDKIQKFLPHLSFTTTQLPFVNKTLKNGLDSADNVW
jgi:hypothetical protein